MNSIIAKFHAAYVDLAFAAKAHDVTPAQAIAWTIFGAVAVCAPTAFFYGLGLLYKATH